MENSKRIISFALLFSLLFNANILVNADTKDENIKKTYYDNKVYIETTSEPKVLLNRIRGLRIIKNAKIKNNGVVCNLDGKTDENSILKKLIDMDESKEFLRRYQMPPGSLSVLKTTDLRHMNLSFEQDL